MVNHAVSTVVRVIDFAKSYNKRRAVEKVSLEINRGEIFGLIGPDGAGKSTLMKAIAGVLSFDRGIVEVFGVTLDSEESAELVKHRIGFMPQGLGLNLYAELSVEENIDFFARLRGVKGRELEERKKKLLAMTRLDRFTDRAMKHLSGGMKQKLGLICTLIHQPELIILDEPTTGVDPVSRRDFWEILTELLYTQGITAIVSTAYLDEAERFHRLAFMFDGRVLASGDPAGLRRELPGNVFEIVTPDQIGAITRLRSRFSHVDNLGGYIRVLVDNESPGEPVTELLKGITITRVEETDPTLEDVFVALLRRDRQGASSIIGSGYPAETEKIPESAREDIRGFSSGEVVIEACELTRDFGSFRAVDRASFEVKRGEIFGLLGANGAGKTTLIKMLTGILPPTSGEGRIAGVDMRLAGKAIKERIGYMSQAFSLYQDLTVMENLRLFAGIYGVSGKKASERIAEVIDLTGLGEYEESLAGRLPMGIRQRLALACAIIHSPHILFLDEPTSGVDPLGRRRFWDILTHLARAEGVAILITTHYMSEAEHCDRLAIMHAGRIVAYDSPSSLKAQLKAEVGELLAIRTKDPFSALGKLRPTYPEASFFGDRIHVFARNVEEAMRHIRETLKDGTPVDIVLQEPTLEDVFIYRITKLERFVSS